MASITYKVHSNAGGEPLEVLASHLPRLGDTLLLRGTRFQVIEVVLPLRSYTGDIRDVTDSGCVPEILVVCKD